MSLADIPTGLILEAIVAGLLIATVFYTATLDRRLRAMRADEDGLKRLIADLVAACDKAQQSVAALREANGQLGEELGDRLTKGRSLADELAMMVEAGDRIADRLGQAAERSQNARSARAGGGSEAETSTGDEDPLLDALRRAR